MKRKLFALLLVLTLCAGLLAAPAAAYPNTFEYIDEEGPNDTLWDAQPIQLGKTYGGSAVAYAGDSDLFTFTLEEDEVIRISMESSNEETDLALFDSNGKLLANAVHLGVRGEAFDLFTIFPMELAAGTYYVGVWTTDGTNNSYFFKVSRGVFPCEGYHQFFTGKPSVPATCQSEGVMVYTCLCGETRTEVIPADADSHTWQTEIVTPYTCTENGLARHTCTGCGIVEDETLYAEHTEPGKLVIQDPTMDDYGMYYLTCADCGFVDEEERPLYALDHMFIDVEPENFYELPVCWAVYKNITSGTDSYHFSPNGECLRAQVVTFLWRAEGCPEPEDAVNPFVDVKESDFYYKAVLWAVENGITNGSDATHFNPFGVCNRAQVVTFLHRAFDEPAVENAANPFSDVPADDWYTAPVLWAVENGITNGLSTTEFGPNAACNRAQIVTFLYRASAIPMPEPPATYTFELRSNDPSEETGYVLCEGSSYAAGESVIFYAEPWYGYLVEFEAGPAVELELYYLGANTYELIMPEHDVVLTANFIPAQGDAHYITTNCANGFAFADCDFDDDLNDFAKPGELVLFYIVPDEGFTFSAEGFTATVGGEKWENCWYLGELVEEDPELGTIDGIFLVEMLMPDADVSVNITCTAEASAAAADVRIPVTLQ